jgi:hypothetical protein
VNYQLIIEKIEKEYSSCEVTLDCFIVSVLLFNFARALEKF